MDEMTYWQRTYLSVGILVVAIILSAIVHSMTTWAGYAIEVYLVVFGTIFLVGFVLAHLLHGIFKNANQFLVPFLGYASGVVIYNLYSLANVNISGRWYAFFVVPLLLGAIFVGIAFLIAYGILKIAKK